MRSRALPSLSLVCMTLLGACDADVVIPSHDGGSTSTGSFVAAGGSTAIGSASGGAAEPVGSGGRSPAGGASTSGDGGGSSSTEITTSTGAGGEVPTGGTPLPGPITDVFDPAEVYLLGTVQPGSSGRDAMAHWSDPFTGAIGFIGSYSPETASLQTNGKLIYVRNGVVREFVCDQCPYVGSYPNGSDLNDVVYATPPCVSPAWLESLKVGPSGEWLHGCSVAFDDEWYDANGVLVYGDVDDKLVHLGYSNLALTESRVVDLASGTSEPIVGLPGTMVLAARALAPASFRVAVAGVDESEPPELWEIDATGLATLVGVYPTPPLGFTVHNYFPHQSHALEPSGALLQIGNGPGVFQDVIVRRELGASAVVVYDEDTNPTVQIHISRLVTGP
jgi:hypothetical protein